MLKVAIQTTAENTFCIVFQENKVYGSMWLSCYAAAIPIKIQVFLVFQLLIRNIYIAGWGWFKWQWNVQVWW